MAHAQSGWLTALVLAGVLTAFSAHRLCFTRPPTATLECGPTSLFALTQRLGLPDTYPDVRRLFGTPAGETTLQQISDAARAIRLQTDGMQTSLSELKRRRYLGILYVDEMHFVAVIGYEQGGVRIADPIAEGVTGDSLWTDAELSSRWSGRLLRICTAPKSSR